MFNKCEFVGKKKFWRYQNARYNDKKYKKTMCAWSVKFEIFKSKKYIKWEW
jgi:hypothetical protein